MQPKETFQDLSARVEEAAEQASGKAQEFAAGMSARADEAVQAVGEKIAAAGANLWEKAPAEGAVGEALGAAAAQIEAGGEYLAESSVSDLAADVAGLIRKHPIPSIFLGACVGLLIGAALSQGASLYRNRGGQRA